MRWKSVMLLSCHAATTHATIPDSCCACFAARATAGVIVTLASVLSGLGAIIGAAADFWGFKLA